jgi:outer membrane protein
MKNIFKIAVVGAALIVNSFTAKAQKTAHINLDSLIALMPESKTAQAAVQEYSKQLEQQITAMQAELQTKYQDYQANSANMAEVVKASKEKELNDLNQRITDFQQQAQTEYQKKNAELAKPVYEKAKKAIEQVAKENGYKYVLDTSSGLVIYSEPADDIIALVIKKLGIIVPPPGSAPANTLSPKTNPSSPKK